jgi:type IV pilus assembly protein PilB
MAGTSLKDRLLQILTDSGLITKEQLEEAAQLQKAQGGSISNILIDGNYISENELMLTLSEHLGIPPINLSNIQIPEEVISIIPKQLARFYQVLPISKMGNTLTVAMADPLNVFAIDDLKMLTKMELQPVISTPNAIAEKQNEVFSATSGLDELLKDSAPDVEIKRNQEEEINIDELLEATGDTSVIQVVNIILVQAVQEGASDIHIEPFEKDVRVRFRTDGILYEKASPPKHMHPAVVSRIKIMSDLDIAERRLPQDGRFRVKLMNKEVDFRVSMLPTAHGEKVVLRILDKSSSCLELEKLGFNPGALDDFKIKIHDPHGMILVTGPTGSGKTTTLYSTLAEINKTDINIVTVEDPIEYQLDGINQVPVSHVVGLTFSAGLRSILRQDPDVVLVGEIRDGETADIAIKAALTGHLVFSTLHTNDAASAVTRLIDMGIEPFLASSSLLMVLAQRLVRRICENCKETIEIDSDVLARAQLKSSNGDTPTFYHGKGCEKCGGLGYKGRMSVVEVLSINEAIRQMIIKQVSSNEIKTQAIQDGMKTLRMNALEKALKGETTLEEVLRVTSGD